MKEIQPVSIWYNGTIILATLINMASVNDNLIDTCIFYYELLSAESKLLTSGNLTMTGVEYTTYSTSANSNEYAYQWGATQLNLTLV